MYNSIFRYAKLGKLIAHNDNPEKLDFLGDNDLDDIIKMIKSIEDVDTSDIPEEFLFFSDEKFRNYREDKISAGSIEDKVLSNTKSQNNYFVVPKVIDSE